MFEVGGRSYRDGMILGAALIAFFGFAFYSAYKTDQNGYKIIQIKSTEDRDNTQGQDTIITEDGRTFKIEEKNGRLSLLEQIAEKAR